MSEIPLLLERLSCHRLTRDLPHCLRRGGRPGLVLHRHQAPHHPAPGPALLLPFVLVAVEAAVRAVALTAVPDHAPADGVREGGGLGLLSPGGQ